MKNVRPKPRDVFENPSAYIEFITVDSDDSFEGQHFDRKQVGQGHTALTKNNLDKFRDKLKETISAFANANVEGGLLVLGVASNGTVLGIDHLSETQKNSLTQFDTLLNSQAAQASEFNCSDSNGNEKTILLIFVPHAQMAICETPGQNPEAWIRTGPQNSFLTHDRRDDLKHRKGLSDFENTLCCEFDSEDIDFEVLREFRRSHLPMFPQEFDDQRLLKEVGAIMWRDGKPWFTSAGLLFFGLYPQRFFAASYIRLLRFEVSSNDYQGRGLPTFEREFKGSLTKQIRTARLFFRESAFFKRYQKRKDHGGFIEEPEFPSTAVDEAIVNSVAHRDYRTGIPIECEAYLDAFIVKNPGIIIQRNQDLPSRFSLADTVLDSTPQNPKLVEWLKTMKDPDGAAFIRSLSEGTKQMLTAMTALSLPPPMYQSEHNETLLKFENNSVQREAAIHAATQVKSTEFANLFPLSVRNGDNPISHQVIEDYYRELLGTLRDALRGNDWFIDKFSFSRITAHRRGDALETPFNVGKILRLYPAYEFQIRQFHEYYYLCIDYKCQVVNIQRLDTIINNFNEEKLINRLCIAQEGSWRDGKILSFNSESALIFFYDTESEKNVALDRVIPYCSLEMLKISLQKADISFDLHQSIKKYSLASKQGSSRDRVEKVKNLIDYLADQIFPIQLGDAHVDISREFLRLVEHGKYAPGSVLVHRLPEPKVRFRGNHLSADIRHGIMEYGAYDTTGHGLQIIPVCIKSMSNKMNELIQRLHIGQFKYKGAERTFSTKLSCESIIEIDNLEEAETEVRGVLGDNHNWEGDPDLRRIFLIHTPEQGYARDDHTSPYYKIKRLLFERGIPCQMVNTPTLDNPDWKDLNLALNIVAKCGVRPWVLPNSIPDADFFIGLSYTQSSDGRRIMGFANVFNSYGKWEFYSGNSSYFDYEQRQQNLAQLVEETLKKLKKIKSSIDQVSFHYSAKMSRSDRGLITKSARKIIPRATFTFVSVNSHHNVRFYDHRAETDGSLRRGSYVESTMNQIYLSTTGYNTFRLSLGTPRPLEISMWTDRPDGSAEQAPDLRTLALQILNLTKLNWASTDSFCGEPITLKYAGDIAYLTAAFLRQSEPFKIHSVLEKTPWFI